MVDQRPADYQRRTSSPDAFPATPAVQALQADDSHFRVLPLTGITLPFVSYGGSALVSNYVILALLVRMSHEQRAAVPAGDGAP